MRREGLAVGLFFVAAGALFLLDAVEVLNVRAAYLWPLLLIGFGIALIAGGRRRREPAPEDRRDRDEAEREAEEEDEERAKEREAHRADTEAPPQDRRDDDGPTDR